MIDTATPPHTPAAPHTRGPALLPLVLAVVLLIANLPSLGRIGSLLWLTEDMAHGLVAPFLAVFIAWQHRDRWATSSRVTHSFWGLAPLTAGALLSVLGTIALSVTLSQAGLYLSILGLVQLFGGAGGLRLMAFPLGLLLFTFPPPVSLYAEITLPLQTLASRASEMIFHLLHMPAVRHGNVIDLPSQQLEVAEACSGVRSLVTLAFFSLVYAYFNERRNSVRAWITVAAIPASLLMNVARIVATGYLGEHNRRYAQGEAHELLGYAALVFGFCLVLATHRWLMPMKARAGTVRPEAVR